MTPEQWQTITDMFEACREAEAAKRKQLLSGLAQQDAEVAREVQSLLAVYDTGASALDHVSLPDSASVLAAALVPAPIAGYECKRVLGEGGMSVVYEAARPGSNSVVALKITRPGLLAMPQFAQRFLAEARILRELQHDYICRYVESGVADSSSGAPWLAMEYIDGEPVTEFCRQKALDLRQRVRLFRQICEAIQYAHQKGVLHRDIKPSNVLVSRDGTPKLLDFGIARLANPDGSWTREATRTQFRLFTPEYASPEQVTGRKLTPATDVYSLGVLLYELLAGRRPFEFAQHSADEIIHTLATTDPAPPSTADPALDSIALKALSHDPDNRYASVTAFVQDLNRWLAGEPVRATREVRLRKIRYALRRHAAKALAGTAVAAALVAGAIAWRAHNVMSQLTAETQTGRPAIALMGLHNASARPEVAWISTALMEMFAVEVPGTDTFRAIASDDLARWRNELGTGQPSVYPKPVAARIAELSGARYLLTGDYEAANSEPTTPLRVEWRLQDTRSGSVRTLLTSRGAVADMPNMAWHAAQSLRTVAGAPVNSAAVISHAAPARLPNVESVRFYSEGLDRWRRFDALGAKALLEKAIAADASNGLAHAALSSTLQNLGYDPAAATEAKLALELSRNLPREQALGVRATACEVSGDSKCAVEAYSTLWGFFSDNPEYALVLARVQGSSGQPQQALQTLDKLRSLRLSPADDLRADVMEAITFEHTGESPRQLAVAQRAEAKARRLDEKRLLGEALYMKGRAYLNMGDSPRAMECYREAARLFAAAGHRRRVADMRNLEAVVKWNAGDLARAKAEFQSLETEARALGCRSLEQSILVNYGNLLKDQGDLRGARQRFDASLALVWLTGRKSSMPMVLTGLADIARLEGRFSDAEAGYHRAIEVAKEINRPSAIAVAAANWGDAFYWRARFADARQRYEQALSIGRTLKRPDLLANAWVSLALCDFAANQFSKARSEAAEALSTAEVAKMVTWSAMARYVLARIDWEEGHLIEAERNARHAASEFHHEGRGDDEAELRGLLGAILCREPGRTQEAEQQAAVALTLSTASTDPQTRLVVQSYAALVHAAAGHKEEARQELRDVQVKAHRLQNTTIELEARLREWELDPHRSKTQGRELAAEAHRHGFLLVEAKAVR